MDTACNVPTLASHYEFVLDSEPKPLKVIRNCLDFMLISEKVNVFCPGMLQIPVCSSFIAGGFIRDTLLREVPRDLDLYSNADGDFELLEDFLSVSGWKLIEYQPVIRTWTNSEGKLIHMIRVEAEDSAEVLARFDLTVCCAALNFKDLTTVASSEFLRDILRRELVVFNPAHPVDTLRRVATFLSRGFTISGDELRKLHSCILTAVQNERRELQGSKAA